MKIQQQTSLPINTHVTPQLHDTQPITWVEIDAQALEHNVQQYASVAPHSLLAPVIKSNAYGHGIEHVAKILDKNNNVDFLCVVALSEAISLRLIGIKKPILVLSIINDDVYKAALHDIALVLYDKNMAHKINEAGKKLHKKIHVHIKVDTGLCRLGVCVADVISFIKDILAYPYIHVQGIFTHFSNSESDDQTHTNYQIALFTNILDELQKMGIEIPLRHVSCSAAITANVGSHFTTVRAGIGIYGLWPSPQNKQLTQKFYPSFSLKSVLTWKTTIIQLKEIPAGSHVGYDLTYTTKRTTRIATLPVGYWDGYERKNSNKGFVVINNQLVPIIGRIAMNLMMIDVTDAIANIDDHVTLLGNYPGITADDHAAHAQTINYQIVTSINPLLPRMVV